MVDFLESARKAKELASQATGKAGELRDSAVGAARDARDALAGAAADLREAGVAKLKELLDDFNASLPVLGEMGYTLADVSATLGMPPSMQATFDVSHDVTDEQVTAILARHADRKLTTMLVHSLVQARRLQSSVVISGMKPRGIGVEIGLAPHVAIKFSR